MGGFTPEEPGRWSKASRAFRAEYEAKAWNDERGAWMRSDGANSLDAAVLRAVLFGALDPFDSARLRTLGAVERELAAGKPVCRYHREDGVEEEEATFTACAFWRVDVLAPMGRAAGVQAI